MDIYWSCAHTKATLCCAGLVWPDTTKSLIPTVTLGLIIADEHSKFMQATSCNKQPHWSVTLTKCRPILLYMATPYHCFRQWELLHERGVWAILLGQWRQICKVSSVASFQQRSCGTRRSNCAIWSAQNQQDLRGRTVNSAVEIPSLKTPPQTGLICYDHQRMLQKQLNHSTNNDTTRILPCALSRPEMLLEPWTFKGNLI